MTPIEYYQKQCQTGEISEDPQQLIVLEKLEEIYTNLIREHRKRTTFFGGLRKPALIKGLYVWGGVGIGKTFMMDCFYQAVPFPQKMRMHFHQFMQMIQHELKKHQGKKNPLHIIARKIADKSMLLCFDEFFVNDIADAMILAKLLDALFKHGVCLVTTSNTEPDKLYLKGLQRPLFLPAIELLKKHTTVMHVPTTIDYRLRHLKEAGIFHTPNDAAAKKSMENSFHVLTMGQTVSDKPIEILGRSIDVVKRTDDVIWFEFISLCSIPRSQHDYLEIAQQFHTVFLSNIPVIAPDAKNTISLFIRLIDVFYDANVRLVFSAEKPTNELYDHGYLAQDYVRTNSRLLEMQSEEYFIKER